MSVILNATTTTGLAMTPDNSGAIQFQSNGTNTVSIDTSGNTTATTFIPNGSSAPTNGVFLPTTNTVGFSTASTERMRIDSSGNVGIGTSAPGKLLHVYRSNSGQDAQLQIEQAGAGSPTLGFLRTASYAWLLGQYSADASFRIAASGTDLNTNTRLTIDTSGNVLVGYTSSNGSYKLQVNSQIFATSSTIATSDANYKTNITPLTGALNLVQKLNPVSFNWKKHEVHNFDTETPTVGFLAQEVQSALAGQPYVNSIVKQSEVTLLDDTKQSFLGIAEGNMIALLTKAIQELSAEVTDLKAKVGA